ncbi:MAG: prephenate dehydrogenase [Bacteroidales bacterium]|nr:prephenate dehydrogenase [Bacteroidales bacterium]
MTDSNIILNGKLKVLVVGLGMMGASYAAGLKAKGIYVGGISAKQSTIDYALNMNIIDSGTIAVEPEYVGKFDIIISALYPNLFVEWMQRHQSLIKSGATITDVTGVKTQIISKINSFLRKDIEFIAAHPMAGREVSGIENYNPAIFKGANYLVVPTKNNSQYAIAIAKEIGRLLDFGRITEISPGEHDEMIAFLSQLTHCIAVSLMCCKDSDEIVAYTGDSFRDLTRIANINEKMWAELFMLNKEKLLSQIELFQTQFSALRNAIAADDIDKIKEMMILSSERRRVFNKKS